MINYDQRIIRLTLKIRTSSQKFGIEGSEVLKWRTYFTLINAFGTCGRTSPILPLPNNNLKMSPQKGTIKKGEI